MDSDDGHGLVLTPPCSMNPLVTTAAPIPNSAPRRTQSKIVRDNNRNRPASQTTIFSIYSMYEDSHTSHSSTRDHSSSMDHTTSPLPPDSIKIRLSDGPKIAVSPPTNDGTAQLPYYHPSSNVLPPTPADDFHPQALPRCSSSRLSSAVPLRASQSDGQMIGRLSRTSVTSQTRLSSRCSANGLSTIVSSSARSSAASQGATINASDPDMQKLPSLLSRSSSVYPTPASTPPRRSSPRLQPPTTPNSSALKNSQSGPSTSSKVSLVPSEGEDMDSFHVRSTYAQLEASGVQGDGYEEGIERTRSRLGKARDSRVVVEEVTTDTPERMTELDPKEVQTLASVDRYGFYSFPSHDRLILLSSSPLAKPLGPVQVSSSSSTSPIALGSLPAVELSLRESTRLMKWTRMLRPDERDLGSNVRSWIIKSSKEHKLRRRVYKGIPDSWRGGAWDLLMTRYSRNAGKDPGYLGQEYNDGLDKPSSYDVQIDLDVPRTISGHIMFRTRYGAGQRSLFHVLHSFSQRCPICGYVQGMGPIAATLLCYFEPERVYTALVRLHDAYSLHTVFSPGFPGLLEAIYVQERITQQMMPEVYAAFAKHMISTTAYATKWYITLFSNSVPFQTQLRLWDAFLLEGYDLFIAVAVAIVWVYRDLITAPTASFETILSLLSSFFVPEDEDTLVHWIENMLGDKKLRKSMEGWKEDWRSLVARGEEGKSLL